jgi:probable phosphoglycerate mutase
LKGDGARLTTVSATPETRVLLVRHGETDWNRDSRLQGWAPVPLNDAGREQARRLGAHLAAAYDVERIVASDRRRTRETTALVREAGLDPQPTFERAWRERDVGDLQGLTKAEIFETYPEYDADSGVMAVESRPPGGESLLDLRERVLAGWERLCEQAAGGTTLVVTHGGPIRVLMGHLRGRDLVASIAAGSADNCAVTELHIGEDATVVRENERVGRDYSVG